MRFAALASVLLFTWAASAEAKPRTPEAPAKLTVMGPGWAPPGSAVRVHRGRRLSPPPPPAVVGRLHRPTVVLVRPSPFARPGFAFGYPPRDWTAERFGQSDWSGDSFGVGDFGGGPWGEYGAY